MPALTTETHDIRSLHRVKARMQDCVDRIGVVIASMEVEGVEVLLCKYQSDLEKGMERFENWANGLYTTLQAYYRDQGKFAANSERPKSKNKNTKAT